MLILAFDTSTSVSTVALVRAGELIGEEATTPRAVLATAHELLAAAESEPGDLTHIVVGLGPGSFTSTRIGLSYARGLALGLELPCAGVSALDALAHGAPGSLPIIDARRREVFLPGPRVCAPVAVDVTPGGLCVGDGACAYRDVFEGLGGVVPPDDDPRHIPWARHHVTLATRFGRAEELAPLYVRVPDVDQVRP